MRRVEPTGRSTAQSAGRTALALSLVSETLAKGGLIAWVDLADAFDPRSALEAIRAHGGTAEDLDRLLWIRARDEDEALQCCERLLRTEGFELVLFDLFRPSSGPGVPRLHVKDVTWLRLARLATGTRTTLIALSGASSTGSRAEVVLEMQARGAHFDGPPDLLEALEARAILRRHRSRPTGQAVVLLVGAGAPFLDGAGAPLDAVGAASCAEGSFLVGASSSCGGGSGGGGGGRVDDASRFGREE